MRILTIIILITLYVHNAYSYELYWDEEGKAKKWYTNTIDIYLDPSLEEIAPADEIYSIIEESFLIWNDYIEEDITLNFIRESCMFSPKTCISYGEYDKLATTQLYTSKSFPNKINYVLIKFNKNIDWSINNEKDKVNFKHVILHEIGHFWGLDHSDDPHTIMYPYYNQITVLHEDDINGITDLYAKDSIYNDTAENEVEYHLNNCSFTNISNTTKSIFSLLF